MLKKLTTKKQQFRYFKHDMYYGVYMLVNNNNNNNNPICKAPECQKTSVALVGV